MRNEGVLTKKDLWSWTMTDSLDYNLDQSVTRTRHEIEPAQRKATDNNNNEQCMSIAPIHRCLAFIFTCVVASSSNNIHTRCSYFSRTLVFYRSEVVLSRYLYIEVKDIRSPSSQSKPTLHIQQCTYNYNCCLPTN